jgi:hypothetical protein
MAPMARDAKSQNKLHSYKPVEAFVQCNFLDGYKYIDKAGEILNSFVIDNEEVPRYGMNLDGLLIREPSKTINQLRITPNSIWLHFVEPKNLGNIADESAELINRVLDIIKPTIYQRIGWRTYLVREDVSVGKNNPTEKLVISESIKEYEFQNLAISKRINNFESRIEISPVAHTTDATKKALLFDVDLAKNDKNIIVDDVLGDMRQTLRSDELLSRLEELIVK